MLVSPEARREGNGSHAPPALRRFQMSVERWHAKQPSRGDDSGGNHQDLSVPWCHGLFIPPNMGLSCSYSPRIRGSIGRPSHMNESSIAKQARPLSKALVWFPAAL